MKVIITKTRIILTTQTHSRHGPEHCCTIAHSLKPMVWYAFGLWLSAASKNSAQPQFWEQVKYEIIPNWVYGYCHPILDANFVSWTCGQNPGTRLWFIYEWQWSLAALLTSPSFSCLESKWVIWVLSVVFGKGCTFNVVSHPTHLTHICRHLPLLWLWTKFDRCSFSILVAWSKPFNQKGQEVLGTYCTL